MAPNEEFRPDRRAAEESDAELRRVLRAIRPRPSESFRRELDRRAAAGFPPRRRDREEGATGADAPRRRSLRERLKLPAWLRPAPILAGTAVLCAVAAAVVISEPERLGIGAGGEDASVASGAMALDMAETPDTEQAPPADVQQTRDGATEAFRTSRQYEERLAPQAPAEPAGGLADDASALNRFGPASGAGGPIAADRNRRAVERDASITLATEPAKVDEVAAEVLRVASSHRGIVMSSTTRGGLEGEAGAVFALKIPSARLGDALAELSDLAPVRHRSESSLDITAPTVSLTDRLREAQARVRSLLKQLAAATSDTERETIEIDLAPAQRRVARLRSQLNRLERRANFADVHVAIVTGEAGAMPERDEWTIADAANDALRVLTVVGGIMLIAAAILSPIGLLALVIWAIGRLWLRRARERALREEGAKG